MDNQLPPITPVIPQTGGLSAPPPVSPPIPAPIPISPPIPVLPTVPPPPVVPTHPSVHDTTVHAITKKQLLFIVGLGLLGLVLGAGVAFLLNSLGINLVGG